MELTITRVAVYNPRDMSRGADLKLIVDTGSAYTWIKRERLKRLGIKPTGRVRFRTIKGELIEREVGEAIIECMGEKATRIVVFAEKEDVEVLGVDALEGLGLEVDPITRQLRKTEALRTFNTALEFPG
jgi:predicted aspartyl protease